MHLRHSRKLTRVVVLGGLLWLGLLIGLTMSDFASRHWITAIQSAQSASH
jgi:caa(3)-type oxidase subunit IV